jgi:TPR repeat protein
MSGQKNFEEAFKLVQQAAEEGQLPEAQFVLGTMLTYGQGCQVNGKEGLRWISKAKKQGYKIQGRSKKNTLFLLCCGVRCLFVL